MKKQTKGILAFAFLGGLMLTSGVLIAIPGFDEDVDYAAMDDPEVTPERELEDETMDKRPFG